jgi:hypothetical protein
MSKLLGSVLVDTGRVALFRQKDRALWSKREEGEVFAILVWGRDAHVAIPLLQENLSFQVTQNENGYLLKTDAKEALEKELEGIQRDNVFMWQTLRNNSQDRLWIHNDPIFPIDAEGTGKAYIVRSGEGDGEYPEIPLTKGGAMVWFDHHFYAPDRFETLETVTLSEREEWLFIDICHLDEGDFGTTVKFKPGTYAIEHLFNKNRLSIGLRMICKK